MSEGEVDDEFLDVLVAEPHPLVAEELLKREQPIDPQRIGWS